MLIHLLVVLEKDSAFKKKLSHFTDLLHGYVVFIITSFLVGVESEDQCLLNSKVLSRFSGVVMGIRLFLSIFKTGLHVSDLCSVKQLLFIYILK